MVEFRIPNSLIGMALLFRLPKHDYQPVQFYRSMKGWWLVIAARFKVLFFDNLQPQFSLEAFKNNLAGYIFSGNRGFAIGTIAVRQPIRVCRFPEGFIVKFF